MCVILLLLKDSNSKTFYRNDKHEIDTVSYATRRQICTSWTLQSCSSVIEHSTNSPLLFCCVMYATILPYVGFGWCKRQKENKKNIYSYRYTKRSFFILRCSFSSFSFDFYALISISVAHCNLPRFKTLHGEYQTKFLLVFLPFCHNSATDYGL